MLAGANHKPEPPVKQRLSSAERREAIVRSAIELFAQNGFKGTTTRELAAAVGVSEPVLYQHFPSKGDLYTAIVDQMTCKVAEGLEKRLCEADETVDEQEYFQWLGEQVLHWYLDTSSNIRLLLFSALEGHELAQLWHERATREFGGAIERYLSARAQVRGFQLGDVSLAAKAFICMVAHFGMVWGLFQPKEFVWDREYVVRQFVQIYLNGIRPRPTQGEGGIQAA